MWSKPDPNQRLQNANYLFLILECRISCEGHLFQKNYGFRPEIQIAPANKTWQFLATCSFLRIFVIIYGWLIVCNYLLTNQRQINQLSTYLKPTLFLCVFFTISGFDMNLLFYEATKIFLIVQSLISFLQMPS